MTKDLTMDCVRAGQLAVMQPEVQKKLEACAVVYMGSRDMRTKTDAKGAFYNEYYKAYDEAVMTAFDPKELQEMVKFGADSEKSFERDSVAALEIGEGLAEMAFIKSVRAVAKVESIDFSVARTHTDILLESRAPNLAKPRQQETQR